MNLTRRDLRAGAAAAMSTGGLGTAAVPRWHVSAQAAASGPAAILGLYGPLQRWFDKAWRPEEIVRVG